LKMFEFVVKKLWVVGDGNRQRPLVPKGLIVLRQQAINNPPRFADFLFLLKLSQEAHSQLRND